MFKFFNNTLEKLLGDKNDDDESSNDDTSETSHDVQSNLNVDKPVKLILGKNFNRLNQADSFDIRNNNMNQLNQINSLGNDLNLIGKNVFELNTNLNKLLAENKQQECNEREKSNLFHIKHNIGNNLKVLNEKLNSLPSISDDNQLLPVLGSTLNQLEITLQKIKSTINNNVILNLELGNNIQLLN
ncbi:unnamed protein product, partial [Rotaria sordida]